VRKVTAERWVIYGMRKVALLAVRCVFNLSWGVEGWGWDKSVDQNIGIGTFSSTDFSCKFQFRKFHKFCERKLNGIMKNFTKLTRRSASIDRTAHRQFQATGQWVSRTQASDDVTAAAIWGEVCATQVLPMRVCPFAFIYEGNGATPCQYIDTTGKAIDCARTLLLRAFIIMKLCSTLFVLYCGNCSKDDKFRYFNLILRKLEVV